MKSILIVDDERSLRNLLCQYLEDAGYTCWTVQNVKQAKELLRTQHVDLLLSDINMPGESGIDLTRFVKKEYPDLSIIIVSVIDNPDAAKEALELDVSGYIVKPFSKNVVLIAVDNALRRHKLELQNRRYRKDLETTVQQQIGEIKNQVVFLQNLMDAIPSAIFHISSKGIVLGCNKVFEQFIGKTEQEMVGKSTAEISPGSFDLIYRKMIKQLPVNTQHEFEMVVADVTGKQCDMIIKTADCMDARGEANGAVGVMLDITDRKVLEQALHQSEAKYRQIIDDINIGVVLLNPQLEITQMNPHMQEWFPSVEPNAGFLCYQSFQKPPKESPCENCPVVKTFAEGKSFETTTQIKGKGGSRFFRDHSSPIYDDSGKVVAAILLVEDVTKKLVLEQELQQSQKLEAIGQLAAGIAHEINTPIQYVGDNIEFFQDAFADLGIIFSSFDDLLQAVKTQTATTKVVEKVDSCLVTADLPYLKEEIPRAIAQSLDGVRRVTEIVRAMKDFSHPGSDKKSSINLNHAIKTTVTVARNEWKYVAEMELDLDESLPEVLCFPGEVNQVLLNIIVNAAHAISDVNDGEKPEIGKIKISTQRKTDSVAVYICDSGHGIPQNVQHRIFDPFFTTKGVGKGTGQGLSIAHSVITDKHGGKLRFESEQGKGTTFIIELPLASQESTKM